MSKNKWLAATALSLTLAWGGAAVAQSQKQNDTATQQQAASGQQQSGQELRQAWQELQQAAREIESAGDDVGDEVTQRADQALQRLDRALEPMASGQASGQVEQLREDIEEAEQALRDDPKDAASKIQEMETAVSDLQQDGRQQSAAGSGQGAQVNVQQQAASVEVERKAPQVTVEQRQPQVTVTQPKPEVTVEQSKPEVTVSQAKPEVSVTQAKPEVNVQQSEADVKVRTEGGQDTRATGERTAEQAGDAAERTADRAGQAVTGTTGQQDRQVVASTGTQTLWYDSFSAEDLIGREVRNGRGDSISDIEDLVVDPSSGELYAVLSVGGFLGIGDKEVAVSLDRLQQGPDDTMILAGTDEEALESQPAYDERGFRPIERTGTLGQPIPPSKVRYEMFELRVSLEAVVRFDGIDPLRALGLDVGRYGQLSYVKREQEYPRSQENAEACWFLGADGILVPSARKPDAGNLIVFCEQETKIEMEIVRNHGVVDLRR